MPNLRRRKIFIFEYDITFYALYRVKVCPASCTRSDSQSQSRISRRRAIVQSDAGGRTVPTAEARLRPLRGLSPASLTRVSSAGSEVRPGREAALRAASVPSLVRAGPRIVVHTALAALAMLVAACGPGRDRNYRAARGQAAGPTARTTRTRTGSSARPAAPGRGGRQRA